MIGGIFSRLARVRFTIGYVAILLAISCAILALGPHAHDVLVQRASTNLHNLAELHRDLGEYRQALSLYQEALLLNGEAPGKSHPSRSATLIKRISSRF